MEQARKKEKEIFMKIANLVLGLISSLNMLFSDGLIFLIAVLYSLNSLLDTTGEYTGTPDSMASVFGMTILVLVIAIASLVMCIVGFVKSRKPDATTSQYTVTYGIVCGISVVANIFAIMITTWLSGVIENGEKVMVWPEVGFVLTAIMIVLTVLNAIKNRDSQGY